MEIMAEDESGEVVPMVQGVCHNLPQEGGDVFLRKMQETFKLQAQSLLEDLDMLAWNITWGTVVSPENTKSNYSV